MICYLNILPMYFNTVVPQRRVYSFGLILLSLTLLSGCMQKVNVIYIPRDVEAVLSEDTVSDTEIETDKSESIKIKDLSRKNGLVSEETKHLQKYFKNWRGVRYRYGGLTSKGVDCSGLSLRAYKELYNVKLPRTVREQARKGTRIQKKNLRPGDLVFFKTGRYSRHVGIYLGENKFIHASRSKGVTQSNLNSSYWRSKYWKAKRFKHVKS